MGQPIPWNELESAARRVAAQSYSPYSCFKVGAALLTEYGAIVVGTNVENASYGLTCCAERAAIFAAVAAGSRRVEAIVVYTPTPHPTTPCGACRQVLHEFGPDAVVRSICDSPEQISRSLGELLPSPMGAESLAP